MYLQIFVNVNQDTMGKGANTKMNVKMMRTAKMVGGIVGINLIDPEKAT